jgi:hypothetical protein
LTIHFLIWIISMIGKAPFFPVSEKFSYFFLNIFSHDSLMTDVIRHWTIKIGTSRLVLPIEKLVLPNGTSKVFEESSTIEFIRRQVINEMGRDVENIITEYDLGILVH